MSHRIVADDASHWPGRRLYGRRHGHRLRPYQAGLMTDLLPRLTVPLDRPLGDPAHLFEGVDGVWLEIGFGGGEHLAAQARLNPRIGFIGAEPYLNGVASLLAQIDRGGQTNIRIASGDARALLDGMARHTLSRVFLLFPDPWPKKRHHRRRFIAPQTLDSLSHAMRPGADVLVATDSADYCAWTLAHIAAHADFDWQAERPMDWRQRPQDTPPTRYERKAVAAGRMCYYLRCRRR